MSTRHVQGRRGNAAPGETGSTDWVVRETANGSFKDLRLGRRFRVLLEQLAASPGGPIPIACQDWSNTKVAYRFLDNDRVCEAEWLEIRELESSSFRSQSRW